MSDQVSKVLNVNQICAGMIIQHGSNRNKRFGVVTESCTDSTGRITGFETLTMTPSDQPIAGCRAVTFADSRDMGLSTANGRSTKQFFIEPDGCYVSNNKDSLGTRAASDEVANIVGEMNGRHFDKYVEKTLTKKAVFNINSKEDFARTDTHDYPNASNLSTGDKIAENMIFKTGAKPDPFFKPKGQESNATGYDVSLGNAMALGLLSRDTVDQLAGPRAKSQPATLKSACAYIKDSKSAHAKTLAKSKTASDLQRAWGKFMGDVLSIETTPETAHKYAGILMRPAL